VTITLTDGRSFQETVLFPKGDPQDPAIRERRVRVAQGVASAACNLG
jgi:hypothetical protein